MRDLLLSLPAGIRPRLGIEQELRDAIRSGRLSAGSNLPSSRTLAADLGVARSTVVAAYEQLAVEGYVTARQGSSTVVAPVAVPATGTGEPHLMSDRPTFDFRPGEPAAGSFPRVDWQRSVRRVLGEAPDEVFGYGDPSGRVELRVALTRYLARARAVHTDPAAVFVYGGFAPSLGFIGEMLRRRGIERIAVEQPMLWFHRRILELVGLETVSIAVDHEGMSVDALARADVGAALVTPGNQQPLGITMSSRRRSALVEWARSNDGWVLEDDYDGEFRYDRRPIGALQGLDPDRVIYAGTASKTMGPGLHLSWLVVPAALRDDLREVTLLRAGVSNIDQLALADFVERGAYDRHVRRQRRVYQRRREQVIDRLRTVSWLHLLPGQAGMHVVALIRDHSVEERAVIDLATRSSIGLLGLGTHFAHDHAGLVINVCRPAEHAFAGAVVALIDILALAWHECQTSNASA